MLRALGSRTLAWAAANPPWTNVYGLARSLIALSSALTMLLNDSTTLFRPVAGVAARVPMCTTLANKATLYCLLPKHLDLARLIAVVLLLVVASGWRPRYTALVHWWLCFSYQLTGSTMEGGDQAAAVLTLLLLPIAFTDPRRWHWQPAPAPSVPTGWWGSGQAFAGLVALSAALVIRLQVSGIYFHSSIAKLLVPEWQDGTAMYYWLSNPVFGAPSGLRGVLMPLMRHGNFLAAMTWGPIIVEIFLFMGLVASRSVRRVLLPLGVGLHLGILLLMGLFTFSITMFGALILYLRPFDEPFVLSAPRLRHVVGRAWAKVASRKPTTVTGAVTEP
jgi:antimicrobial peptide system SdpB family protein